MAIALGIDVGTSAVKAVLVGDGAVLARSESPLQTWRPKPGWSEQQPDHWIDASKDAIRALNGNQRQALGKVGAIGLSGQMHGTVLLGKDHRPLRPAILWNDFRASAEAA